MSTKDYRPWILYLQKETSAATTTTSPVLGGTNGYTKQWIIIEMISLSTKCPLISKLAQQAWLQWWWGMSESSWIQHFRAENVLSGKTCAGHTNSWGLLYQSIQTNINVFAALPWTYPLHRFGNPPPTLFDESCLSGERQTIHNRGPELSVSSANYPEEQRLRAALHPVNRPSKCPGRLLLC